jgi:hypothetical protein
MMDDIFDLEVENEALREIKLGGVDEKWWSM